mgnify:CR=1 FL=1
MHWACIQRYVSNIAQCVSHAVEVVIEGGGQHIQQHAGFWRTLTKGMAAR